MRPFKYKKCRKRKTNIIMRLFVLLIRLIVIASTASLIVGIVVILINLDTSYIETGISLLIILLLIVLNIKVINRHGSGTDKKRRYRK